MRNMFLASIAAAAIATPAIAAPVNVPALQSTIKYTRTATGATGQGNYARATSKIVYDAATGSYTLRDTGSLAITSTFTPANIDAVASTTCLHGLQEGRERDLPPLQYRRDHPGHCADLHRLRPVAPDRHASFGTGTAVNDTYLVFGTRTASADMPRIGGATYDTILDGTFVNKNGAYAVSGTGTLSATSPAVRSATVRPRPAPRKSAERYSPLEQ